MLYSLPGNRRKKKVRGALMCSIAESDRQLSKMQMQMQMFEWNGVCTSVRVSPRVEIEAVCAGAVGS